MHKGKLVFAQLNEHLPKPIFRDCVKRYAGRYPTLSFSHWDQLLCMMFAQLTARTSLRDIELCLGSHSRKLYHAGFRSQVARSTLADANERRDCRIFEDFALHLIGVARSLYGQEAFGLDLDFGALYAPTWWWSLSKKDSRWRGQCTPSCRSSACPCSRSSRWPNCSVNSC